MRENADGTLIQVKSQLNMTKSCAVARPLDGCIQPQPQRGPPFSVFKRFPGKMLSVIIQVQQYFQNKRIKKTNTIITIVQRRSHYKEQWMVVVAEEDLVNHERTTSSNGQASRCRDCCASRMTEIDGNRKGMHLSKYPQRRLGVMVLIS